MRVALFTETFLPKIDGIVTRLAQTVKHLVRQGVQVRVYCPAGAPKDCFGAEIHGVSGVPCPWYPELTLAIPKPNIGWSLQAFQPDLVHVVNPAFLGVSGVYYAGKHELPLLASYHTHLPKYLNHYGLGFLEETLWKILRRLHNQAALNLCTSDAMVQELREHGIQRLDLWQKGVDTELFHPSKASDAMRWKLTGGRPGDKVFLYVGRLAAEKEIERLEELFALGPHVRVALVGDGPHRQQLERHFKGKPVEFVGYLRGEALASAFASADAFVLPSRTETLGLVLLEAMAAGCPVLAARAGGITDIVTSEDHGRLFDPNAPAALKDAAAQLMEASGGLESMRSAARSEAERWGWSAATSQLIRYYEKVAGSSRPLGRTPSMQSNFSRLAS